jgi:hypothetical protein
VREVTCVSVSISGAAAHIPAVFHHHLLLFEPGSCQEGGQLLRSDGSEDLITAKAPSTSHRRGDRGLSHVEALVLSEGHGAIRRVGHCQRRSPRALEFLVRPRGPQWGAARCDARRAPEESHRRCGCRCVDRAEGQQAVLGEDFAALRILDHHLLACRL